MPRTNDHWTLRVLVLTALLLGVATLAGATEVTLEFPNNTGEEANDLHVEFKQQAKPIKNPMTRKFGDFKNANQTSGNKVDFSNGTVADGAKTEIEFKTTSPKLTIKKWYWTKDGKRIGKIHKTLSLAVVSFDQSEIAIGELATVELFAAAALDSGGFYQLHYSIGMSDGTMMSMPPVEVAVPGGEIMHQQLWSEPLNDPGTYTIEFKAINLETGDVLTSGTSTVTVDSGMHQSPELVEE